MHYFSSLEYSICVYFYSCVDAVPSVSVLSFTKYGLVIQWFVPRVVEHGDLRGFQITVVEINPLNDEVKNTRSFNAGRPVRAFLISTIKNPGTYRIEVRPLTGLGYGPPGTIVYTVRVWTHAATPTCVLSWISITPQGFHQNSTTYRFAAYITLLLSLWLTTFILYSFHYITLMYSTMRAAAITYTVIFQCIAQHNYTIYNSDTCSNDIQCVHIITIQFGYPALLRAHYCIA